MTNENALPVEEFAARARSWLASHMPPADPTAGHFFFTDASTRTDEHDRGRRRALGIRRRDRHT